MKGISQYVYAISTLAVALAAILFPLLLKTTSPYRVVSGVDTYESHWQLDDRRVISQDFISHFSTLQSAGLILVPYGHTEPAGDIVVRARDSQGRVLGQATIAAAVIKDDAVSYAQFKPTLTGLRGQRVTLELSTTLPPDQSNVAVRFNPSVESVADGTARLDTAPLVGDVAMTLVRESNWYGKVVDKLRVSPTVLVDVCWAVAVGVLIAAGLLLLHVVPVVTIFHRRVRTLFLLGAVLLAVVIPWRVAMVKEVRGESGGDAYNFFFTTQRIIESGTFFNAVEKRLPFYPTVLAPTQIFTNDIMYAARVVNHIIIGLTVMMLLVVGRQLRLPDAAIFLGALLLLFNRDVIFVGYRPLAYHLTGLLVLTALALVFWSKGSPRRVWLAGVVMGLAAETRHEAIAVTFVLAAVLIAMWVWHKRWWTIVSFVMPLALLVLPFFIANAWFFGNPFYSGYIDHPVTNPRRSWVELQDNLGQSWGVISSTWWHRWSYQMRIKPDLPIVVTLWGAAVVAFVVPALRARYRQLNAVVHSLAVPLTILSTGLVLNLLVAQPDRVRTGDAIFLVLASAVGCGVVVQYLWRTAVATSPPADITASPFVQMVLVILAAATLFGVATWIHPVEKTYVSFFPYLSLLAGLGLYRMMKGMFVDKSQNMLNRLFPMVGVALMLSVLAIPFASAARTLPSALDAYSRKQVLDWIYYSTARAAASASTGGVAVRYKILPVIYWLEGRVYEIPTEFSEPSLAELRQRKVQAVIWFSDDPLFAMYADEPDRYPVLYSISAFNRADKRVEGRVIDISE